METILGRVGDPRVRHVGDVQQTVDAAEIDKRPEVGDVLDDPFADLPDFQFAHQLLLGVTSFFFNQTNGG